LKVLSHIFLPLVNFNLFPIPTNELIYLTSQYDGIISVFNLLGDVLDVKIHRSPVTLISLEYYSPGIYVVQFNSNKITHTKKIQKI
jgi:hypothetical protein